MSLSSAARQSVAYLRRLWIALLVSVCGSREGAQREPPITATPLVGHHVLDAPLAGGAR